jgi:hypothetical protein
MTAGFFSSTASKSTTTTTTTTTVHINEFDVLTGRDRLAFGHPGNRFFRQLCALHREAYQTARKRSVKTEIIQAIIAQVKERDGRFLTLQDEGCNYSGGGYIAWIEMNAAATHQKVSHSLRSGKMRASSDESASSSSSLPSLSASSASGSSRSLTSSLSKLSPDASSSFSLLSLRQRSVLLSSSSPPAQRRRKDSLRKSLSDMHDFLSQSCPNLGGGGSDRNGSAAERIFQDLDKPFTDIHIFDRGDASMTPCEGVVEELECLSSTTEQAEEKEPLFEEERRSRISRDSLCLFDAIMLRDSFASVLPDMPKNPSDLRFSFYGPANDLDDDLIEV